MNLLLDTQIAIWATTEPERLPSRIRDLIQDPDNLAFVSAASIWEIAIKFALPTRRGAPPYSGSDALRHFQDAGFELIDIDPASCAAVDKLPPIHSDPFDRLLVAQALQVPLRMITADAVVARYNNTIILAG